MRFVIAELKMVYTQEIQGIEFGTVQLVIEVELKDANGKRKQTAVFSEGSHHLFGEDFGMEGTTVDANADGSADYLIRT